MEKKFVIKQAWMLNTNGEEIEIKHCNFPEPNIDFENVRSGNGSNILKGNLIKNQINS